MQRPAAMKAKIVTMRVRRENTLRKYENSDAL